MENSGQKTNSGAMTRIGLDIGITSVGWAVMKCDENGEPVQILGLGSRIFEAAEMPKTGGSLAADRRTARSMRRRLRRKGERLRRLRALLSDSGVTIEFGGEDANMLRIKGLDSLLSDNDFARILYLLCKNRGFKSSKKEDKNSKEGLLLQSANINKERMQNGGYRTVGEMIYHEFVLDEDGKWHNGRNDYSHTVYRDSIQEELKLLFEKQRQFGNALAASGIEQKYFEIFTSQRPYDIGPGKGSKYSAEYAVGNCVFEPDEKRAPKAGFSFEWCRALEKLNNVLIKSDYGNRPLTQAEREQAMLAMRQADTFNYLQLRQLLGLNDDEIFNLSYPKVEISKINEAIDKGATLSDDERETKRNQYIVKQQKAFEKKQTLSSLKCSNQIKAALSAEHGEDVNLIDNLAQALSYAKSEQKRAEALRSEIFADLSDDEICALIQIDVDKFGMLSLKALRKIIPHLEAGKKYSEACEIEYGSHTLRQTNRTKLLNTPEVYEVLDDITSPVVKRAVSQTLKVINAIVRKYGSPFAVNIELARDLSRPYDERKTIEKQINDRYEQNEKIKNHLVKVFGITPKGIDIVKWRLYEEQQCKCIYSGAQIDLNRLFDGTSYQIDHIMPFSRSFNDSYNNKALVLTAENQKKGNRLPFEYMSEQQFAEFEGRVRTLYAGNRDKRDILLKKKLDETEWQSSALNDTRYISTTVKNLIENHLMFDLRASSRQHVFTYNGKMTAYVRKQWGIEKVRSDGDLHHAVDAAVIACMTVGMRQRIERYNKYRELYKERSPHIICGEVFDPVTGESFEGYNMLPKPYPTFREELVARTEQNVEAMRKRLKKIGYPDDEIASTDIVYVSRMPRRKMKGKMHKETLSSAKYLNEGLIVSKTPLTKLKLDKDGEIVGYFKPESDPVLYNLLKGMLQAADGKADKAFGDTPVYKPLKDGSQGPRVYGVKTFEYTTSGFRLNKNGAIAENGNMCRVDVYTKDGKFYLVPIYVSDLYTGVLPTKAATQGKSEAEWRDVSQGYEFLFSLHKNDLIYIENNKGMNLKKKINDEKSKLPSVMKTTGCFAYFSGMNRHSTNIEFEEISGSYKGVSGPQKLKALLKYEVDVLGAIHPVKGEVRMPLNRPKV